MLKEANKAPAQAIKASEADASFYQQAEQLAREMTSAYCERLDMDFFRNAFSQEQTYYVAWGKNEYYPSYDAICATLNERLTKPYYIDVQNVATEVIPVSASVCIVLLTAELSYRVPDAHYKKQLLRSSLVFRKEATGAKIVYLHTSPFKRINQLLYIKPESYGNKALEQVACDEAKLQLAHALFDDTPNGLVYFLISEHYPVVYRNQNLCKMLGYTDFADLLRCTKGQVQHIVYPEDLELVKSTLRAHINGVPYTLTYRLLTKEQRPLWVLERGVYVDDGLNGEDFYIATIIPIKRTQCKLNYGNLLNYERLNNPPLSLSHFLAQTLDYMDFTNRQHSIQQLLQHASETLQLHGIMLYRIEPNDGPLRPYLYYDSENELRPCFDHGRSWREIQSYFDDQGFSTCSDLKYIPEGLSYVAKPQHIRSTLTKSIIINNEVRYVFTAYYRFQPHDWTDKEQELMQEVAKLLTLLLDENF
ncbi:MAG: PAS domain-containing protein [Phascolarctobacterium sp.]|nr:PAS domain-containing protein [Phascolarctobacterium sp.]